MRLLHLTDTHLGIKRHFRGSPDGWSRADDHLAAFLQALRHALEGDEPVDAVIHSGDLFDRSHAPLDAVAAASAAFAEVARRVPVYLLPGNHDGLGLSRAGDGQLGYIPGVTIADEPTAITVRGARIGLLPFRRSPDDWGADAGSLDGCDLLVAHQAFHGARVAGFTFRAGSDPETIGEQHIPTRTRTILCGHVHPRQSHTLGPATVFYAGSTERTAFAERRETKGYAVFELGRAGRYRHVDLPSRPMLEVHRERDVAYVRPGALVRLGPTARTADIEHDVLARGGWVVPWKPPERQVALFGGG